MEVGRKLREMRQARHLSQGDIEKKVGLLRCYTSRVEKGHTIPNVETLEKFAYALEIPLYRFFTNGEVVRAPKLPTTNSKSGWGTSGKNRRELRRFAKAFKRMDNRKQKLLVHLAEKMAIRHVKD
jgi:transcriptional regulator with XRE-family HTH domain